MMHRAVWGWDRRVHRGEVAGRHLPVGECHRAVAYRPRPCHALPARSNRLPGSSVMLVWPLSASSDT